MVWPSESLLFAPLVFGIPHVAGDLFLLVVRERRVSSVALGTMILVSFLIILNAATVVMLGGAKPIDETLLVALVLTLPVAALSLQGHISIAGILAGIFAAVVLLWPHVAMPLMAYLHNFVAVVFLFSNCRSSLSAKKRAIACWLLLLSLGVGLSFVLGGFAFVHITDQSLEVFWSLIPSPSEPIAAPLLFAFGYTQILHLMIWAFLLPSVTGAHYGTGALRVCNAMFVVVALVIVGLVHQLGHSQGFLFALRSNYLLLVSFHGWMELSWILMRLHIYRLENSHFRPRELFALTS